jgi:uncharacterized SAM-binding protein YcdF (DUF218 family)
MKRVPIALWRIFRAFIFSLGLILFLVTVAPPRWYAGYLAGPWRDPAGKVLIVLGGDSVDGIVVGQGSYWRSVYAVRAWRTGTFEKIIVAGEHHISDPMRDFMVGSGVPASVIRVEGKSMSTRENALFSGEILRGEAGPYVLLTSDYHMWRAYRVFEKAGLRVLPRPLPDAIKRYNDWRQRWVVTIELAAETVKIIYYWARGWI